MHTFADDALIVYDPFGLTRLTLSTGKSKHNKKVVGRFLAHNGSLLVGHSVVGNNRFAMSVPEMKVVPISSWNSDLTYGTAVGVTPDGLPFHIKGTLLSFFGLDGKSLGTATPDKPKKLKGIDLGPTLPLAHGAETHVATGPDGTFVVVDASGLSGGTLSGTKKKRAIENAWTMPLAPPQGVVRLRAGAFGAFISVFHAAQGKAYCALISKGKVAREVVDSLGPADFDGTRIAYQAALGEVHRKPFGGEVERIELPVTGRGDVMAHGDHLFWLSPDGETIHDLMNDETHVRGLPDAERANRQKIRAFLEKLRPAASAANLTLELEALEPPAYGGGPRPRWSWDAGDQSLLSICVVGNLIARSYDDRDLSAGSYSNPMYCARGTAKAVAELLAAVDEHELDLLAGLSMTQHVLEESWGGHKWGNKSAPLFDPKAARELLWAVMEAATGKSLGKMPPAIKPETVIAKLDPKKAKWSRGHHSDAQTAAAFLLIETFGAAAAPVLIDWLVKRPSGMVKSNMHIIGDSVVALVHAYPKTKAAFAAYPELPSE